MLQSTAHDRTYARIFRFDDLVRDWAVVCVLSGAVPMGKPVRHGRKGPYKGLKTNDRRVK